MFSDVNLSPEVRLASREMRTAVLIRTNIFENVKHLFEKAMLLNVGRSL